MNSDTNHKALKVILFSQLLVEAIDDVKNTSLYKFKTKSLLNNVEKYLKDNLIESDNVYSEDAELSTNLFNQLDELVGKLANNDVVELVMINQIHSHYTANKQDWENLFTIEMTKIDAQ
ncbi:hypothetical protein [Seonamhaeicola sp.]|uniref:hypothetical protein n=1 Tax=Seonamhaeicola sp. TaxID=1912245 RepID=UPI003568AA70